MQSNFGPPVLFSVLSNAHTFSAGSVDRFSASVMRYEVSGTWWIWDIVPSGVSEAVNVRTTFKALDSTRTVPLAEPRKRESEPVASDTISDCQKLSAVDWRREGDIHQRRRSHPRLRARELGRH